jgi:hypothetical protein
MSDFKLEMLKQLKSIETQFKHFDKRVQKLAQEAFIAGQQKRENDIKNYFKETERRLYAYPDLILNIEKYTQDIKDLEKEFAYGTTRKSSDIARMIQAGVRLSEDEILAGKILLIEKKISRDQHEIDEIDYALEAIKEHEYFKIIEYKYFQEYSNDQIVEKLSCDITTLIRNKNKLINRIMRRLYGADVTC